MKITLKKLLILSLFSIVCLFKTGDVFAWIPGTVSGTVEAELSDGSRVGLVGAVIYRQDFWTFSYCQNGGSCFGYKDGVETVVGAGGGYSMGNDQNNPGPACFTINPGGNANLCPSGEKGKIDYSRSDGELLECQKEQDGSYTPTQQLNWCGFNCGANPHRWEAYFPVGYKLPGDLVAQGYSHTRGKWKLGGTDKQYYEEEVGNHGNIPDKNFLFVLDSPVQVGVCVNMIYTFSPAQPKIGDEVSILIDKASATNCHGNWDFLYVTVNGQRVNTEITGTTTYKAKYTPTQAGVYEVQITFNANKDASGYGDDLSECPCNKASFTVVEREPELVCKSLTASVLGTGQYAGQTPQISSLPNDFTGAITLTCVSESTLKPVNKMEFTFVKDQVEQKKLIDSNSSPNIACSNVLGKYTCTGNVSFDITGSGNYLAHSKVCIVSGSTEKCSQ